MNKNLLALFAAFLLVLAVAGCSAASASPSSGGADVVSSASVDYYQASSLDKAQLFEAIKNEEGGCTIATVNADGTPNLIVAVPGVADDTHVAFGWADNATKSNLNRGSKVTIAYYLFDKDATEKDQRYRGARVVGELESDQAVIDKILADNPSLPPIATFIKVVEVLPIG